MFDLHHASDGGVYGGVYDVKRPFPNTSLNNLVKLKMAIFFGLITQHYESKRCIAMRTMNISIVRYFSILH